MGECVRIKACAFFSHIMKNMPASSNLFMKTYCHGKHETCARNMLIRLLEERPYQISEAIEAKIEEIATDLAPNQQEKVLRLFAS